MTYADVGGCKEQIDKLREVVETPLLHVSFFSMDVLINESNKMDNEFMIFVTAMQWFKNATQTSIRVNF